MKAWAYSAAANDADLRWSATWCAVKGSTDWRHLPMQAGYLSSGCEPSLCLHPKGCRSPRRRNVAATLTVKEMEHKLRRIGNLGRRGEWRGGGMGRDHGDRAGGIVPRPELARQRCRSVCSAYLKR